MNERKAESNVYVRDNYINENYRETTISSRHHSIIRVLENASKNEIDSIMQHYIQCERDYAKPINKIKKLTKRIIKK